MEDTIEDDCTFKSLGVTEVLCEACERLKWKTPTPIQKESIPLALEGRDIIGLAETGSGKTGAFAIPIVQALLQQQTRMFALILTPTRELAVQIAEHFEALGASINLKCATIIGGVDKMTQAIMLAKKPHIIIGTPGRIVDHLETTKGFNLRSLKYLVLDEADRILNMDFEKEVNKILAILPKERNTYLYSATMTSKVSKLQRASLRNPAKVEVNTKLKTSDNLQQFHLFIPAREKDAHFIYLLNELAGNSIIVFCDTCMNTLRVALMIRSLGFTAIPLHGQMSQNKRLGALNKFKSKDRSILICTDVMSRGIDIPHVDVVINLYLPNQNKSYIHRVGRAARAGRAGKAYTFVTQYDVELYQGIEQHLGYQLPKYDVNREEVMLLMERVSEAQRCAKVEMSEMSKKKGREFRDGKGKKRSFEDVPDDAEESLGVRKKFKKRQK